MSDGEIMVAISIFLLGGSVLALAGTIYDLTKRVRREEREAARKTALKEED